MSITDPDQIAAMRAGFAARDRACDGRYVVCVTSTGIYCRPSCPARRPRPEHLRFYDSGAAARAAGFRPCKRCRPDEAARDSQAVAKAAERLRNVQAPVPLAMLAEEAGYSPAHFQRIFTRAMGLSPAAYARALRDERARRALSGGGPISEAIYEAGFEAPSRFYELVGGKLGMTPSAWAKGGTGVTISWAIVPTSLGEMLIAATDKGVCRISFGGGREELERIFPRAELVEGGPDFASLLERVVRAVENPASGHDIPLDVRGTAFQERVWQELRRIPPGETRSYAELAAAAGNPKAVRAAGSANGANHVPVLIPCHRVVRSDGSLGGYAFGPEIKRALLEKERSR